MGQGKKEEAEAKKAEVAAGAKRLAELEARDRTPGEDHQDHDGHPQHY